MEAEADRRTARTGDNGVRPPDGPAPEVGSEHRVLAIALLAFAVVGLGILGVALGSVTEGTRVQKQVTAKLPTFAELPPGARDDFARPDDAGSLGRATTAQVWHTFRGVWGVAAGRAYAAQPAATGPSLATLAVGRPDGSVQVTAARMASGLGLAFRCRGPRNCWTVEAAPEFGTWNVVKVVKGRTSALGNLGTAAVADGTRIRVDLDGDRLTFFVDGKRLRTITDAALRDEARAGLVLREAAGAAGRWAGFEVSPPPPKGLLAPTQATVRDDFHRADSATGLGAAPTGQVWRPVSGVWGIKHDLAYVPQPVFGKASLALVDVGNADGIVQATGEAMPAGTGIAFRCRDLDNCWLLEAVPGFGTWNLLRVVDGGVTPRGNIGTASAAAGTTISVEMRGDRLTFYVDGQKRKTITDRALRTERGAGLLAAGGANAAALARWSSFAAGPAVAGSGEAP